MASLTKCFDSIHTPTALSKFSAAVTSPSSSSSVLLRLAHVLLVAAISPSALLASSVCSASYFIDSLSVIVVVSRFFTGSSFPISYSRPSSAYRRRHLLPQPRLIIPPSSL
ncbi:hypothetical protein PIB30_093739 [Stylosanthes scabra]|uniref:Uncharacterized protein n=1 Tax=Stylosanthes scabra TaxID=79078 RepID=A0ABU6TXG7_9FABA|nr:hypothetical protein [Stylosanthes scabra]